MSESCYFCRETERLEQHHIVPRRFDGSDKDENLVSVCPTCHSKLEALYDKRFYDKLGVSQGQSSDKPSCNKCGSPADGQIIVNYDTFETAFFCNGCSGERDFMMRC